MNRTLVTILAILLGIFVAIAVYVSSQGPPPAPSGDDVAEQPTETETADVAPDPDDADADAPTGGTETPVAESDVPEPAPDVVEEDTPDEAEPAEAIVDATPSRAMEGLRPRQFGRTTVLELGSLDQDSEFMMLARIDPWTAGLRNIKLTQHLESKLNPELGHYEILTAPTVGQYTLIPFAARSVEINGQVIAFDYRGGETGSFWRLAEPATASRARFEAIIENAAGEPVLRIERTYLLSEGSYEVGFDQRFYNLTGESMKVRFKQNAQPEVSRDKASYIGDTRRFIPGYFDLSYDKQRKYIYAEESTFVTHDQLLDYTEGRRQMLRGADPDRGFTGDAEPLWPNPELADKNAQLVWLASTNRYFALAAHRPKNPGDGPVVQTFTDKFPGIGIQVIGRRFDDSDGRRLVLTLQSSEITLPANGAGEADLMLLATPRDPDVFAEPSLAPFRFDRLVHYSLGGMCAMCTFQWLAHGLIAFLRILHDVIVFDWAIAIIILVACVRGLLHPITKRSQTNMMKMSRQMQSLQPEMEKIKKKYADDDKRKQQEIMKLYREKGVNPANMLGCLPMFLQMPIWVALYAMLYFAVELRHEPAFFGAFQTISGGAWHFLHDLSSPDRFIVFSDTPIHPPIPLLGSLDFSSLNILPICMAVIFFLQQQFMAPPPTNDQAAQQQKIMKFMMLLFPLFLYAMPSGLTLYILASSTVGVVESYMIRKHIKELEEQGEFELGKKKPEKDDDDKPKGFMARMQEKLEEKQREMGQAGGQGPKPGGGGGEEEYNRELRRKMKGKKNRR